MAAPATAYYAEHPDPAEPGQRVAFGTSGHRGSAFRLSFNEDHIAATSQAICDYRARAGITGPLFIGRDTHALSEPAFVTALEVLAANDVDVLVDAVAATPRPPRFPARFSRITRAGRTAWPTALSSPRPTTRPRTAASSTTRPTAGRPCRRSRRRSRSAPMIWSVAGCARSAGLVTPGPRRRQVRTTSSAGTWMGCLRWWTWARCRPPGYGSARTRLAPQRRRPGRDRRPVRARPDGGQPGGGRHLPVHDAGLGRQDPDGLLLAVCHGVPDRAPGRVRHRDRQRHRRRPARHRDPGRGPAQPQPLPGRRDRLPVPAPGRLARRRRGRQDDGQLRHHRPGDRGGRAAA